MTHGFPKLASLLFVGCALLFGCIKEKSGQKLRSLDSPLLLSDYQGLFSYKNAQLGHFAPFEEPFVMFQKADDAGLLDEKEIVADFRQISDKGFVMGRVDGFHSPGFDYLQFEIWQSVDPQARTIAAKVFRLPKLDVKKEEISFDELAGYRLLEPTMSQALLDSMKGTKYVLNGKEYTIVSSLGMGGTGSAYEVESADGRVALKLIAAEFYDTHSRRSSYFEDVLAAHRAIGSICATDSCDAFVRFIEAGYFRQVSTGLIQPGVTLELGEKRHFADRMSSLIRETDWSGLRHLISQTVQVAKSAFALLRRHQLCHMDAKPTNFIFINSKPHLADYDYISPMPNYSGPFKLAKVAGGVLKYMPPEKILDERWIRTCSSGYDEFYFAYSLFQNLEEPLKIPIRLFRRDVLGAKTVEEHIRLFNSDTLPDIEKILEKISPQGGTDSEWEETKKSLRQMLSTDPNQRYSSATVPG